MSDHDADVAAVMAEVCDHVTVRNGPVACMGCQHRAARGLAALAAAGYAIVKIPEGVAVEHGARLVPQGYVYPISSPLYLIEDTP